MTETDILAQLAPDLADRMRKSLRVSGIGAGAMAEHIGVARETVSTWINGRHKPSPAVLRVWAEHTGVPYQWLRFGDLQLVHGSGTGRTHAARSVASRARHTRAV